MMTGMSGRMQHQLFKHSFSPVRPVAQACIVLSAMLNAVQIGQRALLARDVAMRRDLLKAPCRSRLIGLFDVGRDLPASGSINSTRARRRLAVGELAFRLLGY